MSFLQVPKSESVLILNTPKRNEILKAGPPATCDKANILGRGAYGIVFKAIFQAQPVAVKIVKNRKDASQQSTHNEAQILNWKHRNIVKILKIESTPNFGIIIMERFVGQCLQLILDNVELPLQHRVFITLDILSALSYCHKRNLLHLDVKPQNVLVSFGKQSQRAKQRNVLAYKRRSYICKLCDFGAAQKINAQNENACKSAAKGTVRYMSPEALREEPLTKAADIYSLGITMWQLQYGSLPYHWIECNDVVAYQVVKNNLRPNSTPKENNTNAKPMLLGKHNDCFCIHLSAMTCFHSVQHLKKFLSFTTHSAHDNANLKTSYKNHKSNTSSYSHTATRRAFRELNFQTNAKANANANMNSNVVRDLSTELGLLTSSKQQYLSITTECSENFQYYAVFKQTTHKATHFQITAYETLYTSCWQSDAQARLTSLALRKRLENILL